MDSKGSDLSSSRTTGPKDAPWWRWSHGTTGSISSSSDSAFPSSSHHTYQGSARDVTTDSSSSSVSSSDGVRWQKRSVRNAAAGAKDEAAPITWSVPGVSTSSLSSPFGSQLFVSTTSPKYFSARSSSSRKKTPTYQSRARRTDTGKKKWSTSSSSSVSAWTLDLDDSGISYGRDRETNASSTSAKYTSTEITWNSSINSSKKVKKPSRTTSGQLKTTASSSARSFRRSSEDEWGRDPNTLSSRVSGLKATKTTSSRTKPRTEPQHESITSQPVTVAASKTSVSSPFASISPTSKIDPLVSCAREVLDDCQRTRFMDTNKMRKRNISDAHEAKCQASIYHSRYSDCSLLSSSDDELSQLSTLDSSFQRDFDAKPAKEELYRELMLCENDLSTSPDFERFSPLFEEKGLSVEVRYQLPLALGTANETDKECTICQVRYGIGDHIITLPCQHFFHACCVDKWLWNHTSCPLCRTEVSLDIEQPKSKHNFTECPAVDQETIRRKMRSSSQNAGFRPVVPANAELSQLQYQVANLTIQDDRAERTQPKYLVRFMCNSRLLVPPLVGYPNIYPIAAVDGGGDAMSDSEGESAMAYFLPNGIADDSPPKRSTMLSSFGSIGNSPFRSRMAEDSDASLLASPLASGSDFASMLRNQSPGPSFPAATATSPPGDEASARSKFLLSDLAGEVHHPQAHRLEEKRDSGTTRSFGFPGTIGKASGDADGSGRSMFDRSSGMGLRTSEPDPFGFPRSSAPSTAVGLGSTDLASSSIYSHPTLTLPSYLNTPTAVQEGSFDGARMWTDAEAKPRRVLHSPPGLSKPSSNADQRSGLRPDDRLLPNHRATRNEGLVLQPHLSPMPGSPFASAFAAKTQSSLSGTSAGFSSLGSELSPNLKLSSIQMTPDVFSSPPLELALGKPPVVLNPALAELNSESVLMEELQKPKIIRAERVSGSRTGELSTRELQVSSRQKAGKIPKPTGQQRKAGDEKAMTSIIPPSGTLIAPRSPVFSARSGRRALALSPSQAQQSGSSLPLGSQMNASEMTSDRSTKGRLKKRGQSAPEAKQTASRYSPTAHSAIVDVPVGSKKKGAEFNWTDQREENSNLTGSESSNSPNKHIDDQKRTKPRDIQIDSSQAGARGIPQKKNAPRGTDEKVSSAARRQVYREKQPREPPQTVETSSQSSEMDSISSTFAKQENSVAQVEKTDTKPSQHHDEGSKQTVCTTNLAETRPQEGEWVTHKKSTRASKTANKTDAKGKQDPKSVSGPKSVDLSVNEISAEEVALSSKDSSTITAVPEKERKSKTKGGNKQGNYEPPSVTPPADKKHTNSKLDVNNSNPVPPMPAVEIHQIKSKATPEQDVHQEPEQSRHVEPSSIAPVDHEKKTSGKKDKSKKDKSDKKRGGKVKKEKRDSSSSSKGDHLEAVAATTDSFDTDTVEAIKSTSIGEMIRDWAHSSVEVIRSNVSSLAVTFVRGSTWVGAHTNVKGWLQTAASNFESVMAVVFSVLLLCSLHGASWFIRIHRVAFRAILTHRHIGFCFAFLYSFPFLVQYVFPWAPPWAPVCLWYAFLVQLFCTSGPTAMVTTFRVILPLVFLLEGISHHSFLLDLNGAELLLASFILSAVKTSNLCSPIFMLSLAIQCLSAVFLGSELVVQWFQMALALYSLHFMATSDEDWIGLSEDDPEGAYHPGSLHHSIADYNQHLAPSATSIQKTKHLDRRALAYVKGRKFR